MSEQVFAEKKLEKTEFYPMIPTYEVHRDPNDVSNILAVPIETNLFHLLMETEENIFKLIPVDYEIFRQDQLYQQEIDEKTKELLRSESQVKFDPDVQGNMISPEEEMTSLRANELYNIIMEEWDNIVLGKKTGDWDHNINLEMGQADYFNGNQAIVYERAWEVHDIIQTLVEGHYQPESLFGDYKKIYIKLQTLHGKECARELVKIARLMSRCVSPETIMRTEDIVESTIPATAIMKNA